MIISIILAAGYFALLSLIMIGLLFSQKKHSCQSDLNAAILIVARNESGTIKPLLDSLESIDYPAEKYEVILLDDDSKDKTALIMNEYSDRHANWRTIYHPKTENSYKGKKGALSLGINITDKEIILVTDADCIVQPNWLKSMLSCFREDVGMVLGCSPVIWQKGLTNIYHRFDSLVEYASAAATAFYNKPTHSNARNMAFRRQAFLEVGGYSKVAHVSTGDDYYLTKLIRTMTNWKFSFNTAPQSFVQTHEIAFGKNFIHQQFRRNSKAFDLSAPFFLLASWVFLFHFTIGVLLFIPSMWNVLAWLLGFKFLFEFAAFSIAAKKFRQKKIIRYFPIMWVVFPLVFLSTQIMGPLRMYKWK